MKAIKNRISSKLILILLALIFIIPKAVSQDRLADSTALVAIYQSTNGSGWTNKTGWEIIDGVGSPTPINSWHGVTLTTDRVSGLDLSSNNLGGTLPIEIGDLTALGTLDLAINLISGSVPTTIGALTALSDMNLLGNSFSGTIPTAINSLVNLTSIQLQSNQFTGTIPDFSSLTGLTNFAVSSNNLTGQIPEYLGSLQSLNQLFLSGNQLTGNVPDTLGTLLDLTFLRLDNNQLSDSIPSNFVNLTNLSNLLIHNNEFTHLPDLSTLGSFSTFNVSNNFFTFEDLEVNSSVITLNSSQKNFGSVQNLDFIVGDPISLDAFIPGTGANDTYQWLLNGADIAGATNQTYSKTAELVDAGSYSLRVSNSLFVGADIFSEDIVVNVNPIPINETDSLALVALYNSTNGASWTDNTNWLSGTLDTWVGVTVIDGRVTNLNLQSNEIQGSIPSEIGDLDSLKTISMSSFSGFGGILPSEIGNLSALTTLSLEGDFTGTIPTEIGNLSNLQTFNFYSDLIEGSYPASFGNLTSLTSLDFFGNNMSGSLPAEFSNLINLTRLRITVPEGNIPSYLGDLSSLQILYLTGANDPSLFNGTIPANLGNLTNLSSLTIRNSSVSGTIPVELGSLTSLGTLSLDTNQLSGSIPTEIGSLSGLSTLSFSNNSLTGDVPASFTGLTSLTELELQNNTLTSLPDLSGITSITYFDLGNNYLTFEDLEPNASIITQDASQLLFGSPQNISLPVGDQIILDAQLPGAGASDTYQWQKDAIDLPGEVAVTLSKADAQPVDAGIYRLKVTNTSFPGLEIFSEEITVAIEEDPDPLFVEALSDPEGKVWKIAPVEGAFKVGPAPDDGSFFSNTIDDLTTRDCFFDDTYTFFDDGTFVIDIQGQTFVETWQGDEFSVEACDDPTTSTLNDYNLLGGGTFSFDLFSTSSSNLRVIGKGAFLGLPKVYNGGEYSSTLDSLRSSVTYDVLSYSEESLVLAIDIGSDIWWTFSLTAPPVPTNATDSLALVAMYNSTAGANWFDNANWLQPGSFVQEWAGVTTQSGRVTEIDLQGNNLIGPLPIEIGDLDSLSVLNLGDNTLSSTLPAEFYTLTNLERVYLFNNSLTGDLSQFGSLTKLSQLYINGNQLTGIIPADLSSLTDLQQLGVSNNQLEGILPEELSTLAFLNNLFVDGNPDLNGEVSLSFTSTILDAFKINGTGICEPGLSQYQDWITTLSNYEGSGINCPQTVLESDSVALVSIYNTMSGENWFNNENWLQPGSSVSQWAGVTVLDGRVTRLDFNGFGLTGGFPAELGNLDSLEVLGGANNQITSLPDEISQLSNLRSIYLDNNQIEGSIPLALGNILSLEEIYVQGNQFSGTIPDTLGNITNLRALWLSQNKLTGEVPSALTALSALTTFNLSENRLGSIPSDLSGMLSLTELNLSQNDLDTISASLVLPESLIAFNVRGNALREAPDLTGPNLVDYNIESNRIPFSKLLSFSNTSGLGGQNYRYEIEVDNLLPSVGGSVTISLTSDNADNIFQWYKDGIPLDGETNTTLTIAVLEENDAGIYHAEVGNNLLSGVTTFSEQFELEFGVTAKEYAISATASSSQKVNSTSEIEALGFPNAFSQDDTRAWKPSESDSSPTITFELENATSFNTLWMSVNSNGNWTSTHSYSTDGTTFTEFPIGFSNTSGPGNNLLRWDFEVISEQARFIRVELDSAESINFNTSIDAIAIGLNDFTVNRPQNLRLSQVVSETITNIAWEGSDFGEGVIIERAINSEAFQAIDTAFISDLGALREPRSYSDRNSPASDSIFYRVRAFDGASLSAYSNTLEIINCPTPTFLNTENYWSGDADPNSFSGETSPQSEIVVRQIEENSYNISDIAGGYMDLVALGFEYYPIEANFRFSCEGEVSEVNFLTEAGVGCGGDNGLEFLGSTYFPANDSLVFNLRWVSCDALFNSYLKLTNVPAPEIIVPIQEPAITKSISQPSSDKIEITWQDVNENEDFYLIERSIDVDNNFVLIDSVSQINKSNTDPNNSENVIGSFIDEDVSGGSTFYYRLITRNTTGDSDYSDTLSINKVSDLAFERLLDDPTVTDVSNSSYSGYWADYDLDGDQDLYVHNWQKGSDPFYVTPNNYFYDNNGDGSFTKVENGLTEKATESRAGSWGDMDNDGDLDYILQLTNNEVNKLGAFLLLYENDNGTFTESILGEPTSGGFDHVVLGDFDNDGLLDILSKGFIYFNEGNLSFTETSFEILFPEKTSTSVPNAHAVDIDMDMDLDIYFGGDQASYLYINNGDRTFARSSQLGSDDIGHRGGSWGDYDNDGDFDLFITLEQKPNRNSFRYYRNEGGGAFQLQEPSELGLDDLNLQRGATTMDYNNDGLLDLLSYESFDGNLVILENIGSGQFQKVEDQSFAPTNSFVSAVSVSDYDQDGNQDFFVASGFFSNQSNFIYRNSGSGNNYLRVNLDGTISNKNGLGAVINVFATGVPDQTHQVVSTNGTWAGNELTAHFGLGTATQADSVVVNWTSGVQTILTDVSANQMIEILELGIPEIKFDSLALKAEDFRPALYGSVTDTSATIEIELEGSFYTAVNNMDSTWTLPAATVDSLFSGSYEIIARATNQVGVGIDTAMLVVELPLPLVTFDSLSLKTQEFRPELFGYVSDTSAIIEIELEGSFYAAVNNMDSTWTLAAATVDSLFNGTYEVIARATNIVGVGVDTAMLVIDQSAPFVSIDELVSTVRSPELTGFVDDTTAIVSVVVEDNDYQAVVNVSDSTWTLSAGTIEPPLEDGTYDVLVLAENRFGIASDTTINELRLDATAPEVFVDNIGTSITSPELTGFISDITATLIINVAGRGDFTPIINNADSTWSIAEGTITPGFAEEDNPIVITATAEDSLANIGTGTGQIVITNTIVALEASRVTSNSFRANWSAVVDVVSYTIEVSDISDFSNLLVNETTTEISYDVEDLDFETEYFYRATFDNGVDAPTTSETVSVLTEIKDGTRDDFNALLQIESATGGSNWTVSSNWTESTRKQDWDFIELENERIVEVNIPENNLTGEFPYTPLMTALRKIDVSDNELTDIADLTRLRSINELDLSNNLFEFDDLEKLKDLANFSYSPQKTVLAFNETAVADSLLARVFSDPTLSIPAEGEYVIYDWFLNGNTIETGDDFLKNDSLLNIISIDYDNMGKFEAEVRNDSLPDLTIKVDSMYAFALADFTVDVNDDNGALISDNVDGYLLLTEQRGAGFDTLSVAKNQLSSFTFKDVILGDYLISIDSDREKYVPTYYANAFEWVDADTVMFRKDTAFQLSMTLIPEDLTEGGEGSLSVVVEEDFGDDAGRIDARRRAAKRKCGLRRKRTGGRTEADEFELIAYGETNDNGEFEFGFLPQGVYRFFVEYPGIPLDDASFVEFEVGEKGISETDFKLEAFASEDGIEVTIDAVLGVLFDYFKDLEIYPNPASEVLKISYRHLTERNVAAQLVDVTGKVFWSKEIRSGYDGYEEIDVSEFETGMYILHVYDTQSKSKNVVSYRIMIR